MREEGRPTIQSTVVRSQPNIFVPQQANPLDASNETAREPDRCGERDKCSAELRSTNVASGNYFLHSGVGRIREENSNC